MLFKTLAAITLAAVSVAAAPAPEAAPAPAPETLGDPSEVFAGGLQKRCNSGQVHVPGCPSNACSSPGSHCCGQKWNEPQWWVWCPGSFKNGCLTYYYQGGRYEYKCY